MRGNAKPARFFRPMILRMGRGGRPRYTVAAQPGGCRFNSLTQHSYYLIISHAFFTCTFIPSLYLLYLILYWLHTDIIVHSTAL